MYSIGVDIGGSHVTAGMFEHSDNILIKESIVTLPVDNSVSKSEILSQWWSAIQQARALCEVKQMEGVGLAVPGPFDYWNGISLISGVQKYDSLYKVNIKEELAARLDLPTNQVRFINDAASFSIGEAKYGEASAFRRCVAITLGTGFGSCFLVDGKPIVAAEDIPEDGVLYNKYYQERMADDLFSTRGLVSTYASVSGDEVSGVFDICQKARENAQASQVLKDFGTELGRFLNPHLALFNAEVLVLGGNISKAYDYFGAHLKKQLPGVKIFVSKLNEHAALMGAASLFEEDFYSELAGTLKMMN